MHLIQVLLHTGGLHRHNILVCGLQLEGLQGSRESAVKLASYMLHQEGSHVTGLFTALLTSRCMWRMEENASRSVLASVEAFMC